MRILNKKRIKLDDIFCRDNHMGDKYCGKLGAIMTIAWFKNESNKRNKSVAN